MLLRVGYGQGRALFRAGAQPRPGVFTKAPGERCRPLLRDVRNGGRPTPIVASVKSCVFISYETATGLNLARLAKMRLKLVGHSGWVWQDDSRFGAYIHDEIAEIIADYDHFLCLCTDKSHGSAGQKFERGIAFAQDKLPVVIALEENHVPIAYSGGRQIRTTFVDFQRACDDAAAEFSSRIEAMVPVAEDKAAAEELKATK